MGTTRAWAALVVVASGCGSAETQRDGSGLDAGGADAGTGRDAGQDAGGQGGPLSPACFGGGSTAQLDLTMPVAGFTWNDPSVVGQGDELWMYASATDAFAYPVRLYRLTSRDGEAWSLPSQPPVLDVGPAGSWDAGGVETPAVVAWQGAMHLFYSGYPTPPSDPAHAVTDYRIGHAVSDDGKSFTRVGVQPIVSPSDTAFRMFVVSEPAPVVRDDGALELYFTALGVDAELGASLQVIGMTRTVDGATWSEPVRVLSPDQALYPRSEGWLGYSTPAAIVIDGALHLFVDVAQQPEGGAWRQRALHHARLGPAGWEQDTAPILRAGDRPWAREEVRSPAPWLDGDVLRLYFAGHSLAGDGSVSAFGIGMLTCPLKE